MVDLNKIVNFNVMEDDDEVIENKIQAELDGTTDQQQQ